MVINTFKRIFATFVCLQQLCLDLQSFLVCLPKIRIFKIKPSVVPIGVRVSSSPRGVGVTIPGRETSCNPFSGLPGPQPQSLKGTDPSQDLYLLWTHWVWGETGLRHRQHVILTWHREGNCLQPAHLLRVPLPFLADCTQ